MPVYLGARGWVAVRLELNEVDWDTVNDEPARPFNESHRES